MNIRVATKEDVEQVLVLIREFQEECMDAYELSCDDIVARETMLQYENSSLVLEVEGKIVGVIAGAITTYPLNNEKVFQEALWYIQEKYRKQGYGIALLMALERWCQRNDVAKIVMAHTGNFMAKELEKLYLKMGYKYLETHYIKGVG